MNYFKNKLNLLKDTRFLDVSSSDSRILEFTLLENGKRLRQQIESQYNKEFNSAAIVGENKENRTIIEINPQPHNLNSRLRFVYTNEFRNDMRFLKKHSQKGSNFTFVKTINNVVIDKEDTPPPPPPTSSHTNSVDSSKTLITYRLFHKSNGLAKLYNIQRERKIWWMRFSADPSRYYLEPYNILNGESTLSKNLANSQSINIKSRLPDVGDIIVEHITLVPLNEAFLENDKDFEIYDERTKQNHLPAVIRSVINLNISTYALILDGAANNKRENILFLNRKIAPYQCLVISTDSKSNDLKDLCAHICNVISRSGLRQLNINEYAGNILEFQRQLDLADKLGIPYIIIANIDSLRSGLLELRCRDTTLNETIHISDIPEYLLNIFHSN